MTTPQAMLRHLMVFVVALGLGAAAAAAVFHIPPVPEENTGKTMWLLKGAQTSTTFLAAANTSPAISTTPAYAGDMMYAILGTTTVAPTIWRYQEHNAYGTPVYDYTIAFEPEVIEPCRLTLHTDFKQVALIRNVDGRANTHTYVFDFSKMTGITPRRDHDAGEGLSVLFAGKAATHKPREVIYTKFAGEKAWWYFDGDKPIYSGSEQTFYTISDTKVTPASIRDAFARVKKHCPS